MPELPSELLQARVQLMLRHPYLASAIARLPLINAAGIGWCSTMATDGYYIFADPSFCEGLSREELQFVVAHEVMHCVLGHIDRRGSRRPQVWNQAIDYATNLMLTELGMLMPRSGLLDERFRGMTAEGIYSVLVREEPDTVPGDTRLVDVMAPSAMGAEDPANGRRPGGSEPTADTDSWDEHLNPSDPRIGPYRTQGAPDPDESRRIRGALSDALTTALQGRIPGSLQADIGKSGASTVPWQRLMARFFSGLRRDDYRLFPANRKHIWRGLYLPSVGVPGPDNLVVVIDTSGSMSNPILGKVLTEIDALRSATRCRMTLVQCDARIQRVDEFDEASSPDLKQIQIFGRGGTSFRPAFGWVAERLSSGVQPPDALIYLTDGFGDFPEKPPFYPVLWILTPESNARIPFGEVIRMRQEEVQQDL